ncbi:hypothetical protein M9H77_23597 [Catharanthus roseus]|uniref:Uncharacterized protein n=1 Tax=Catharanthus roseus TaxID=4058 RepID=A0ACC0AVW4_CATRO|nr:hypothetical protein M9H77_23597 [Catharanthus roseus]
MAVVPPSLIRHDNRIRIFRPLSPHLPIYKPQLTLMFPIFHRISGAFLDPLSIFNYLLSLVWNHLHYTLILGLAVGLASLPSRLEYSLPAKGRNGKVAWGTSKPFAAARLANRTQ